MSIITTTIKKYSSYNSYNYANIQFAVFKNDTQFNSTFMKLENRIYFIPRENQIRVYLFHLENVFHLGQVFSVRFLKLFFFLFHSLVNNILTTRDCLINSSRRVKNINNCIIFPLELYCGHLINNYCTHN